MHRAYNNLNSNKKVSRFADLKKGFNLDRHDYLLTDLELAGIKGHVLNWFRKILEKRECSIKMGVHIFETRLIKKMLMAENK